MVVIIEKDMTWAEAQVIMNKALKKSQESKKEQKMKSLHKLKGMLSHLGLSPLEIQEEMRDGWL